MSMMIMFMLYLREYMIVPPKRQRFWCLMRQCLQWCTVVLVMLIGSKLL